jgi:uncharacterized protein YjbJ (UPF0337 family)
MQLGRIDVNKLRGIGDKIIGLSEETVGVVVGNDRWQRAGEARQERASEELKALRKEAEAEAKDAKARAIAGSQGTSSGSGVVTEVKGKVKQAAGDLAGDNDLQRRGMADEVRGQAGRQATQARTEAKAHEAKARAEEEKVRQAEGP